jgi:glycosyltransferase involved in cell wall biosynthesis
MIKVLFVDHTPIAGGAQLVLSSHIKHLDRKKFQPYLLIDKASKHEAIYKGSRVKILKIDFGRLKLLHPTVFLRLKDSMEQFDKVVSEIKPDLVVTNTTRALILAALCKHRYKLVVHIRDYDYPKWLILLLKGMVDKFIFVSRSVKNHYGIPGEVIYVPSSLRFTPSKKKRDKMVVGFVGRLVDWKGPLFLLEAFEKVNDAKLKLVFFGTGKGQSGDVENQLKKRGASLMGHESDLNKVFDSIDIFVLSSIKPEPFSTSLIHAALAKKPIIATDNGGTPEFIRHNKNGILVSPNDTDELADALVRLSKDKKLVGQLVAQAYKDAQEFTEEEITKKLEKLYESSTNS